MKGEKGVGDIWGKQMTFDTFRLVYTFPQIHIPKRKQDGECQHFLQFPDSSYIKLGHERGSQKVLINPKPCFIAQYNKTANLLGAQALIWTLTQILAFPPKAESQKFGRSDESLDYKTNHFGSSSLSHLKLEILNPNKMV